MFKTTAIDTLKQDKKCQPCWYIILSTMCGSTTIKDATAAFSHEGMHAAHEVNGPTFAHAILTTEEILSLLPTKLGRRTSQA